MFVSRRGPGGGSTGSDWERAAGALAFMRENGETHDWWDAADRRNR